MCAARLSPFLCGTLKPHDHAVAPIRQTPLQIDVLQQHHQRVHLEVQLRRRLAVLQLGLHSIVNSPIVGFEHVHVSGELGHLTLVGLVHLMIVILQQGWHDPLRTVAGFPRWGAVFPGLVSPQDLG